MAAAAALVAVAVASTTRALVAVVAVAVAGVVAAVVVVAAMGAVRRSTQLALVVVEVCVHAQLVVGVVAQTAVLVFVPLAVLVDPAASI